MNNTKFSFGKNWIKYLESVDEDRIKIAKQLLTKFMGLDSLKNKTFIDIGCGSGLFSYCAHELGAKTVTSLDIDKDSIKCCQYMYNNANKPIPAEIRMVSIIVVSP